jgi:signal transduction histidine kinase
VTLAEDRIRVVVADDVGGADPERGSGLRGLADRVETVGGTLRVESVPGRGTCLAAEIPLGGQAS